MHNFNGFFHGGGFPLFLGFSFENLIHIFSQISYFILFGAESNFMANCMWISVVPPDGVDDRITHLCNCSFANIGILNMFFCAVFRADVVEKYSDRFWWHCFLEFVDHIMAKFTGDGV